MIRFATALAFATLTALAACDQGSDQGSGQDSDDAADPSCAEEGEVRDCGDGEVQYCGSAWIGESPYWELQWSECAAPEDAACTPGESELCCTGDEETCGEIYGMNRECIIFDGAPTWDDDGRLGEAASCWTPLVLVFDGAPVRYGATPASAAAFDIDTTGACLAPAWPTADTPWLALDRDRSGTIDAGDELFGSGTRLASGDRATNGFAALAELDADGDRRITAADPGFADLVLWSDHDADRRSSHWELTSIAAAGVVAIDLAYDASDPRCDGDGNCEVERAAFEFRGQGDAIRRGEVVDVHVTCD